MIDHCPFAVGSAMFFFFQAEDGIRDLYVTGVQTCALPILCAAGDLQPDSMSRQERVSEVAQVDLVFLSLAGREQRSEERRVGKECRARRAAYHERRRGSL